MGIRRARGKAWGNALGGWRTQRRGKDGKFGRGVGSAKRAAKVASRRNTVAAAKAKGGPGKAAGYIKADLKRGHLTEAAFKKQRRARYATALVGADQAGALIRGNFMGEPRAKGFYKGYSNDMGGKLLTAVVGTQVANVTNKRAYKKHVALSKKGKTDKYGVNKALVAEKRKSQIARAGYSATVAANVAAKGSNAYQRREYQKAHRKFMKDEFGSKRSATLAIGPGLQAAKGRKVRGGKTVYNISSI